MPGPVSDTYKGPKYAGPSADELEMLRERAEAAEAKVARLEARNAELESDRDRWRENHKGVVSKKRTAQAKTEEYRLRAKKLELRVAELALALAASSKAVDDWLHTYAGDMCGADHVADTNLRINEAGGVLAYIADVQQGTRQALSGDGSAALKESEQ